MGCGLSLCSVDQLVEIISVLGTPSFEELHEMNPEHRQSISSKVYKLPPALL